MKPRVCVLRSPGTNCDLETAYAFESAGAHASRVHLFRLLEAPEKLLDYEILCIPGGFSYGDDIGAGVIFGRQLNGRLSEMVGRFLQGDRLVLGICNGFQVLMKSGILPGGAENWPPSQEEPRSATLTWNRNGKYTALWVNLRTPPSSSVFLRGIESIELPVAHAEGRIAIRSSEVLDDWRARRQIALEYVAPRSEASLSVLEGSVAGVAATSGRDTSRASASERSGNLAVHRATASSSGVLVEAEDSNGEVSIDHAPSQDSGATLEYPFNPNGSIANIAGLCDTTGRILGLMPHPERYLFATQHPRWTRTGRAAEGEGMKIFRNAVEYFQS